MTFITIAFLLVAGLLSFLAGVSTKSKEQKWLTTSVIAVLLLLLGVATYYQFNSEIDVDIASIYIYFLAFGVVLPRLVANIVNQNRLSSPTIYIRKDLKLKQWGLTILLFGYVTLMMMRPNKVSFPGGTPIYDEDYFRSRIGFLFFLIPSVIFMIITMLQRTAFCSNGLFHNGRLFDWSDFKSYTWNGDWLQMEKSFVKGGIQVVIPAESKPEVEELLKVKVQRVHLEEKRV